MLTLLVALIVGLVTAYAIYLAPAHAEERKFELQERARRIEQAQLQQQSHAFEIKQQVHLQPHQEHGTFEK